MVQKSENQSQKKAVDTVDKKRPKKEAKTHDLTV